MGAELMPRQVDRAAVGFEQGAAEECLACDCNWYDPADGGCMCGHSIADHKEREPDGDEDS